MLRVWKMFNCIKNYKDTSQEELRGKEVNEEYSESVKIPSSVIQLCIHHDITIVREGICHIGRDK